MVTCVECMRRLVVLGTPPCDQLLAGSSCVGVQLVQYSSRSLGRRCKSMMEVGDAGKLDGKFRKGKTKK